MRLLRSPKEPPLFAIGVTLSVMAWVALAVTVVGILYGALIFVFIHLRTLSFWRTSKATGRESPSASSPSSMLG
jgi:hypothetical protein